MRLDRVQAGCLAAALVLCACQREARPHAPPQAEAPSAPVALTDLQPGPQAPPPPDPHQAYEANAYQIGMGQTWFRAFNCSGCHANGGGGMGPALMDDKWRYGGSLAQIHDTILQGRPNGMPTFKDRITDEQAWQLAAFVRSLSGNADKLAAPSRPEGMRSIPPINNINRQPPRGGDDAAGRGTG